MPDIGARMAWTARAIQGYKHLWLENAERLSKDIVHLGDLDLLVSLV